MNGTRTGSTGPAPAGERPGGLTDRYVHATVRRVPEPRRDDLRAELRSTIDDMVQSRVEAGQEPAAAEWEALLELGDPDVLASGYTEERPHLVGPTYYFVWKRLLLQLLAWVPLLVGVVAAVVEATDDRATVGTVVVAGLGAAASTAIQVTFWVTLVFAVLERVTAVDDLPAWTPERLPELPAERERALGDTVASVAFHVVVAAALVLQHFRSWVPGDDGDDLPVLDPALWMPWIAFLLVVVAASVAVELWKHRRGWTWPVATGVVVTSVAFSAPVTWLATEDRLVNPDLVEALSLSADQTEALNLAIAVGAVAVAAWEVGEALWRAATRSNSVPTDRLM